MQKDSYVPGSMAKLKKPMSLVETAVVLPTATPSPHRIHLLAALPFVSNQSALLHQPFVKLLHTSPKTVLIRLL